MLGLDQERVGKFVTKAYNNGEVFTTQKSHKNEAWQHQQFCAAEHQIDLELNRSHVYVAYRKSVLLFMQLDLSHRRECFSTYRLPKSLRKLVTLIVPIESKVVNPPAVNPKKD